MVEIVKEYIWSCGCHMSLEKTLEMTLLKSVNLGFSNLQFFLGNPYSLNRKVLTDSDISKTLSLAKSFNMNIYSHSPYIHNLCGKSAGNPPSDNPLPDSVYKNIASLEYELSVLAKFPGGGVVIHPGSFKDKNIGIETICKAINTIKFPKNSLLLLENCAGEGNKIPKTLQDINSIISGIEIKNRKHIGVCIDTAHIHGQGDYNFSKISEIDRFFKDFTEIVGIEYFKLLHLNDSKVSLGSKKDRHESLGIGTIWGDDCSSLVHLLAKCVEHRINTILETPELHLPILKNIDLQIRETIE